MLNGLRTSYSVHETEEQLQEMEKECAELEGKQHFRLSSILCSLAVHTIRYITTDQQYLLYIHVHMYLQRFSVQRILTNNEWQKSKIPELESLIILCCLILSFLSTNQGTILKPLNLYFTE